MSKRKVLLFMGPQGSGKGTQARLFANKHAYTVVSTGDIMRKTSSENTELAARIAETMNSGGLISDDLIFDVLKSHIAELSENEDLILDGFPRTEKQARQLDTILDVSCALYIILPVDKAVMRIAGRVKCPDGHTYNNETSPPLVEGVCDVDGLTLSQRNDDNEEAVRRRLAIHEKEIANVLGHYRSQQKLVTIPGDASIDDVANLIEEKLSAYAN